MLEFRNDRYETILALAQRRAALFNTLFEFIADAPPLPVEKFPDEFIALIAAVNQPPAGNYLFSAYPRSEAATIMRAEGGSSQP